jgi:VCBS repeat-containing protein
MDGTATAGSDYDAAAGFVQFTAGQQSRTFTVAIKGDIAAEGNETFVVKLLSASGAIIGDGEATATISNDDQNNAPVAGDDAFSTPFNTVLETNPAALLANDVDVDGGPLTLTAVGGAVNGQVTLQDGKILFTPDAGFSGPASFTYTVTDALGATDTATVAVTVAAAPPPPNRAPVANADAYQVNEDVQLTVLAGNGLLVNDTDPDGNPLIAELVNGPSNGTLTVNPDGSFVYKAAANYHGVDSFTYRARDAALGSYPVTVTITVNPVNDAPAATADSYGVAEDGTLTVNAANGGARQRHGRGRQSAHRGARHRSGQWHGDAEPERLVQLRAERELRRHGQLHIPRQ